MHLPQSIRAPRAPPRRTRRPIADERSQIPRHRAAMSQQWSRLAGDLDDTVDKNKQPVVEIFVCAFAGLERIGEKMKQRCSKCFDAFRLHWRTCLHVAAASRRLAQTTSRSMRARLRSFASDCRSACICCLPCRRLWAHWPRSGPAFRARCPSAVAQIPLARVRAGFRRRVRRGADCGGLRSPNRPMI